MLLIAASERVSSLDRIVFYAPDAAAQVDTQ